MEEDFYKYILKEKYGIEVVIPKKKERELIHRIIYNELCLGRIKTESKLKIKRIIDNLISEGIQGIILGCTELPLIIKQEDVDIPVFNTTRIHAISAVEYALEK